MKKIILPALTSALASVLIVSSILILPYKAYADISTGAVSYYKFDENTGTSASDATGNGNTGTLSGASLPTWFSPAKINSGLNFNGTFAYVNVPDAVSLNPTAITINAWIRGSSFPNAYNAIVHKGDGTNFYEYFVKSNGRLAMYVTAGSGSIVDYDGTGSNTLSPNTWYMVTLVYDTTNGLVGYLNASSDGTATSAGTLTASTGKTVSIGRDSFTANRLWNGDIDEVGIWNRALTQAEVTQLYNGGAGLQYPFSTSTPPHATILLRQGTAVLRQGTLIIN